MLESIRLWWSFTWRMTIVPMLNRVSTKKMRRWWCDHKDGVYSNPKPGECLIMETKCYVECLNCGKSAMVVAGEVQFGKWTVEDL